MKCPPLSEEATVNSQTVWNTWYGTAKPVYDFSTKTCIADSATWPSATVKTTLDNISKTNNNDAKSSTVDASTVKICANCDKRWATCLASEPSVCATCASTLLESAMTKTVGSTTVNYAICSDTCADGKYKDGSNKCVNSCLSNWSKWTDGTTWDRWMNGFFLDDSSATHKCVAESAWPTGKYGDRISGKCQACQSPCATCKGAANNWLSCATTSTFYFFDKLGKWYATCPPGTYQSSTNWVACKTNVLAWDSTGTATPDARSWDSSCNGCVYSPNYCFGCATGKIMAPMGRCVDTCSSDTLLDSSTTPAMCKSCSFGCLKCASETSTWSAGSTATSFSSSSTPAPKCLRCDKNQGFFLLRGRWVKSCPVGTYPDKLTGWWSKCDCNCGTGGCVDRYTCSGWPKSGMSIDLQSGRWKCDATVATAWASDWKSFTITISSTSVRFRDLTAEKANASTNQMKMWRIGNEGSMFDNTSTQSTVTDSFASMRCGDATNTKTEIDYITSQFKNMNVDSSSSSTDVKGSSTSTNSNPSQSSKPVGPGFSSESTVKDGKIQTSDQTKSTTSTSTTSTTQSAGQQTTVSTTATTCPNQKDTISKDDMNMLGLASLDDASIKKYIQGLGILFGDISDKDIMTYQSPTDGLIFTSSPTDLCAVLFDADTLKYIFKTPTCTLAVSGSNTVITVTLGDLAQIHAGFVVKIQPNVFVDGCDWPIMNVQKVTDASNPGSLNVKFKSQAQSAVSCSSLSVKLDSSGSVGGVSCNISLGKNQLILNINFALDTIKDSSGNAITTGTALTTKTSINTSNASSNSGGEFSISSTDISTLSSSGVSKITLKGSWTDSYGQKQMVSKEITLSNGESDITMRNQPDKIVYDSSQSQDVSFLFDYKNWASTSTGVTSTITLQKMTGTNTWADTTSSSEMISNSKTIPKGLSTTTRYRLKVVASAGTKSKEFYIELQSIVKQPDMQTKGIPSFLLASEAFSYTFTVNDFKNVQDLTKVSISFSWKTCSGGKCTKGDSTDLSFSSLYTDSTKTLSIPANTLAANTCYSVSITVAYSGTTNTKDITINTAAAGVKKAIDIGYIINIIETHGYC